LRSRTRAALGCLVLCLALPVAPAVGATTYEGVGSDVYDLLVRLEALGAVRSGLLTTRPLSRAEVARLVREASARADGEDRAVRMTVAALERLVDPDAGLMRFVKPVEDPYVRYVYADSDNPALDYNIDGDRYLEGSNVRAGFGARAELERAAFFANPEYRHTGGDDHLVVWTAYGVAGLGGWDVVTGKQSQWWGPGDHGALLLTNNAKPLTMVRVANRHPVVLPWILRYLGLVRFTGFVTRLEKERDIARPYLWGLRLNIKPLPFLELGASRTAILGGEGRPRGLKTWWDSFTGRGENDPERNPGDQRMAYDAKLSVPWALQPFQLYAEVGGEDMDDLMPVKTAWIAGIYLPRLLSLDAVDFRAEYATTHTSHEDMPEVWYNHVTYTSGYTFKGRIIGHHMGTDSRNIFLASSVWLAGGRGRVTVHVDREEHNIYQPVREKKDEAGIAFDLRLERGMTFRASYAYGRIRNSGGIPDNTETVNRIVGAFTYLF
jgi:hypothetical protein